MENGDLQNPNNTNSPSRQQADRSNSEPVRSRWTPKPEQILILESIFNSGMVNPPKDETVRIRKLLEKFGAVGDANVFYWFQNRRSRSRRRQRQIQASLAGDPAAAQPLRAAVHSSSSAAPVRFDSGFMQTFSAASQSCCLVGGSSSGGGSSSSCGGGSGSGGVDGMDELFAASSQMGIPGMDHGSVFCAPDPQNLHYQAPPGFVTVFINGVATEVPRGPLDMKAMLGEGGGENEWILVHSSGVAVPVNDFGFSTHSLQHGESYFLVPRPS